MTDPAAARAFLLSEIEALGTFDFVAVGPSHRPHHVVEITRTEGHGIEVRVPGRPPSLPELPAEVRRRLDERGFSSEEPSNRALPWACPVGDASAAADLVLGVLSGVFGEKPDASIDIAHGSHRDEYESRRKLAEVREHIGRLLAEMLEREPEQDSDGDYILPIDDVHVIVAPRAVPGGVVVVRIFAITNVGVPVAPELGLMLARLNFTLMFGRFALDAEHGMIWVDETLLGEHFTDEEFRFIVTTVASTADHWDDRLKEMFGGATHQEILSSRSSVEAPLTKPGQGGYL